MEINVTPVSLLERLGQPNQEAAWQRSALSNSTHHCFANGPTVWGFRRPLLPIWCRKSSFFSPQGRCHWTLQLLADELVVLGLVKEVSTETVRQALKKTTSSPGSSSPGASPRTQMPSTSGAWKT